MIGLFLKVLEALDRLATFEMAFGIEQFRCVFSLFLEWMLSVLSFLAVALLHACFSCPDLIVVLFS